MTELPNEPSPLEDPNAPQPPPPAPPAAPETETPGAPGQEETEETEETPGAANELAGGFDVDEFAKSLPPGAILCPICIGFGAIPETPPLDPHRQMCPACCGYGQVRTGSIVSAEAEQQCLDCQGRGWVDRDSTVTLAPVERPAATDAGLPRDAHGRAPDDPEFDWNSVSRTAVPAG